MKKGLLLLAALAVSSALCAQENQNLGREDVLAAFKEYNPAALEKAARNPAYNDLLNKVAAAYSAPDTDERQNEMIALVKNFDNSVRLQAAREEYFNGRTLQAVSGEELAALDARVQAELQEGQIRKLNIDTHSDSDVFDALTGEKLGEHGNVSIEAKRGRSLLLRLGNGNSDFKK